MNTHAHTYTHTSNVCRQTEVLRLLFSASASQGHAAVRRSEKASGAPKCVPPTDMSVVPRVHAAAHHTVPGRTQHLLQLPARSPALRWQQVSALWPAAARDAQRGAGDDSARPDLPLSLQRDRLSVEVQYERHQKAPWAMSTSIVRLSTEDVGEVSVEWKVRTQEDTVQTYSVTNRRIGLDVV
jgi:hypothetical protein